MSLLSTRRTDTGSIRPIRKPQSTSLTMAYHIYCINFYDNGLSAVRNEYINQIKQGLRRFIFVIDMDNELAEAVKFNDMKNRSVKPKKGEPDRLPTDPIELTLLRIQDCMNQFNFVTKQIEAENTFNLLQYWKKYIPADIKLRVFDSKKAKDGMESNRGKPTRNKETTDTVSKSKIVCFGVAAKVHNKVGKGQPLSKRLYIMDQPVSAPILILIIGNLNNEYYKDLLQNNQPLRGIIHFLPEESRYDKLVPRPRREQQLRETIEKIQRDIHSLCKRSSSKPVGIFQQQLPQMSMCQATKFAKDVFNQLTWFTYDLHTLREQYEEYYVKPYRQIDVKLSPSASMQANFQMVDSLSIKGHYLNAEMPVVHDDDGTIYLYLESLMSTFGNPRELMTEMEVLLLANHTSLMYTRLLDKVKINASAFKSILKLVKCERLFVEHSNALLNSVIAYSDQKLMRNIYHACLEYNILRRYFNSGYSIDNIPYTPYSGDTEPKFLPKYGKLYLTDDAVTQRILELVNDYETYTVEEIYPRVKLFTFKRGLNEVFEYQKQIIIPTRLCFRDFTLQEMETFLRDMVTSQMFESGIESNPDLLPDYSSVYTMHSMEERNPHNCRSNRHYIITPSIFIRPKSLKATKLEEQKRERDKGERKSARDSKVHKDGSRHSQKTVRNKDLQDSSSFFNQDNNKKRPTYIGLGPNHPMLTGYNLDDTRQTIKVKTSKYHFEEGQMSLYEEKWNFRQMNKCLSIAIDNQQIHFTNEPSKLSAISSNIRIQTPNGISLRVQPKRDECAKAVLNYPNGLTLYCHDTHAEHLWSGHQSGHNERRRVCTPYGCVIVFYNNNDTVLIMRYNGEVYRLYSYLEVIDEEEEGEVEESSDFINACSTQSTYSSFKPLSGQLQKVVHRAQGKKKRKTKSQSSSQTKSRSLTERTTGGAALQPKKTSQLDVSSGSSATLAARTAKEEARLMKQQQIDALFASIDGELRYLNKIMDLFGLSYKHLKLTTSLGSVVHVENPTNIYCGAPIRVTEWHDYFANESYSMRNDGVRMIWTKDSLKCYHTDGTVITTTTMDGRDPGIIEDDIDKEISSSSSHKAKPDEFDLPSFHSDSVIYINVTDDRPNSTFVSDLKPNKIEEFLEEGEVEDQYYYDYSFSTYTPNSYQMQHKTYAGTQFFFTDSNVEKMKMETKVIAADNLEFRIYPLDSDDANLYGPTRDRMESQETQEPTSSEADADEWTRNLSAKSTIDEINQFTGIEIDAVNLHLWVQEDNVQLNAQLRKFGCEENCHVVRENIELKMDLKLSLSVAFRHWVEEFHKFISCACPKWRTTYFVETVTEDCRKKGMELFKSIPTLGKYNFCQGNYFIDPVELKSMSARMTNDFPWYEQDMAKFPRFSTVQKEEPDSEDLPLILTTKIFVEIPAQLAYTDRIHLFLNPFDKIKFRKLKHRFNEAVIFHLHPRLRVLVQQEISQRSWRNHHLANKKRLFMEQQRLSLYVAMLKHKVYPNYFQFKDQFYSHVRHIDFFEFMASKCSEKENQDQAHKPTDDQQKQPSKVEVSPEPKKNRKKCLCPKYLKSIS